MEQAFIEEIREAAAKRLLYLPHAMRQMSRLDRMITLQEVRSVIECGQIVEEYPEDVRGHSALLVGAPEGRPVHVVCAPKTEYLAIITAYLPDPAAWTPDFRRRLNK